MRGSSRGIKYNENLDEAVNEAGLEMIALLGREWGLSREEAHSLCSIAGNLGVTQVVDGVKALILR